MTLEYLKTSKGSYGFFKRGQKVKYPSDKAAKKYAEKLIELGFAKEVKESKK